jgi:tryptophan synthase alpha chain
MKALQENGADIIELRMPYSDPLAGWPGHSTKYSIALANGMTSKRLFEQLKNFRKNISVPVVLMVIRTLFYNMALKKFCADAASVGIDGLILPDLPEHEFETDTALSLKKNGLDFIFLVTPETSEERIKKLDKLMYWFLYAGFIFFHHSSE